MPSVNPIPTAEGLERWEDDARATSKAISSAWNNSEPRSRSGSCVGFGSMGGGGGNSSGSGSGVGEEESQGVSGVMRLPGGPLAGAGGRGQSAMHTSHAQGQVS
jgi:hypothetical protein